MKLIFGCLTSWHSFGVLIFGTVSFVVINLGSNSSGIVNFGKPLIAALILGLSIWHVNFVAQSLAIVRVISDL